MEMEPLINLADFARAGWRFGIGGCRQPIAPSRKACAGLVQTLLPPIPDVCAGGHGWQVIVLHQLERPF